MIKSEDFFAIIESLGVSMDPSELTNLIQLLAISPEHTNILKYSNLNKLLTQFNSSEQMKTLAMQIYEQIIKEQDPDELTKAKEEEIEPPSEQKTDTKANKKHDDIQDGDPKESNEIPMDDGKQIEGPEEVSV